MPFLRHHTVLGKSGPRNYFGDESDGHIRITTAGAEQSLTHGATWSPIPNWTSVGTEVFIPSVQDGDMVIVNAITIRIDEGMTLTVLNRCRGLLLYSTGDQDIFGEVSMTARGCHANPADAIVTADTPVAPGDGHAVPADGIIIRRLAKGNTDTHTAETLMHGCGLAVTEGEANQPPIKENGIVLRIPRTGGPGGPGVPAGSATYISGNPGGTKNNGTGGGGSGARAGSPSYRTGFSRAGAAGTCFSGGAASGGAGGWDDSGSEAGAPFGGKGGDAERPSDSSGGPGNPGGTPNKRNGTGGLLILICGGLLKVNGKITACGVQSATATKYPAGSSGGGVIILLACAFIVNVPPSVAGGANGISSHFAQFVGGKGGDGSIIGPIKIDPQ